MHGRGGASQFAILGDIVGYGAEPQVVVDDVMALAAQGAIVIQGNHDALAAAGHAPPQALTMEDASTGWTQDQLTQAQRGFLAGLPLKAVVGQAALVHASADAPEQWRYVDDPRVAAQSLDAATAQDGVRYVFGGHVHRQMLYFRGTGRGLMPFDPTPGVAIPVPAHRQWLATAGSVGQPRDGHVQAMYAVFDAAAAELTFHRVDYDHQGAAAAIRAAGLPGYFASRLEEGR